MHPRVPDAIGAGKNFRTFALTDAAQEHGGDAGWIVECAKGVDQSLEAARL